MADDKLILELQDKIKKLEAVRDQLGGGWLQTEREKARLAAAIDSLPLGLLFVDDYNKVLRQNPAVDKILGVSETGEWTIEQISAKLEGGYDLGATCRDCFSNKKEIGPINLTFDDKLIRIFLSPIVLLKESVTVFGSALLIEDISEEKNVGQTRDEFFAIASHELKAPLTAMMLNAEKVLSLLNDKTDPSLRKAVSQIHDDASRLIGIVHDFVDISKIEAGKIPFKKEIFAVSEVISEVVSDLLVEAKVKGLELRFDDLEKDFLKVVADKARVRQVLFNLVSNAIKFTEKGRIRVFIEQKDQFLKISVEDSGPGIDDATRALLFKKFIRSEGEGSGIGLYISKLLVSDMGGEIFLENTEAGKGSTFTFTLPLSLNASGQPSVGALGAA